jgi:galactose-1-phosphate uridylyltransferase
VRGAHTVSGANAAAAEEHHGVLVFDRHDPLAFDAELVADMLRAGRAWADAVRAEAPSAVHYLLIWNCLWRGGGSIVHGHAQVLLGSGAPHGQLARWRRDAGVYRETTGRRLFDDLVAVHRALGLTIECAGGVVVLAHLTPVKERELMVVATRSDDERDPSFSAAVGDVLVAYRDVIGVRAFNLALWRPPLDTTTHDYDLPLIVRLVDRGRPFERPSDIGAMELYGSPVVSSDPFELAARLRGALGQS